MSEWMREASFGLSNAFQLLPNYEHRVLKQLLQDSASWSDFIALPAASNEQDAPFEVHSKFPHALLPEQQEGFPLHVLGNFRTRAVLFDRVVDAVEGEIDPLATYEILSPGERSTYFREHAEDIPFYSIPVNGKLYPALKGGATLSGSPTVPSPPPPVVETSPEPSLLAEEMARAERAKRLKELHASFDSILKRLVKNKKHSYPFLEPVTVDEAPDYFDVITHPMDFSKVKEKLVKEEYRSKALFKADLDLIWANCLKYNYDPDSIYRVHAKEMKKLADQLLEKVTEIEPEPVKVEVMDQPLQTPAPPPPESAPPLSRPASFSLMVDIEEIDSEADRERRAAFFDSLPLRPCPIQGLSDPKDVSPEAIFPTPATHRSLSSPRIAITGTELSKRQSKSLNAVMMHLHAETQGALSRRGVPSHILPPLSLPSDTMSSRSLSDVLEQPRGDQLAHQLLSKSLVSILLRQGIESVESNHVVDVFADVLAAAITSMGVAARNHADLTAIASDPEAELKCATVAVSTLNGHGIADVALFAIKQHRKRVKREGESVGLRSPLFTAFTTSAPALAGLERLVKRKAPRQWNIHAQRNEFVKRNPAVLKDQVLYHEQRTYPPNPNKGLIPGRVQHPIAQKAPAAAMSRSRSNLGTSTQAPPPPAATPAPPRRSSSTIPEPSKKKPKPRETVKQEPDAGKRKKRATSVAGIPSSVTPSKTPPAPKSSKKRSRSTDEIDEELARPSKMAAIPDPGPRSARATRQKNYKDQYLRE